MGGGKEVIHRTYRSSVGAINNWFLMDFWHIWVIALFVTNILSTVRFLWFNTDTYLFLGLIVDGLQYLDLDTELSAFVDLIIWHIV